jgi:hypothetical protein
MTQLNVASALEWSMSKLLRIEAGSIGVSVTDLRALVDLYQVTDQQLVADLADAARESRRPPWWHQYRDLVRPQFAQLLGYEMTASVFLEFALVLLPGPFQTPAYATAVMNASGSGEFDTAAIERGLELRLERGTWLLNRDDVREIVLLLDEFALLRPIGGRQVMAQQLRHLLTLAERDNVHVEVIPLAAGAHDSLGGSLKVLRFDDGESDVLYLSGLSHDVLVRDDEKQISGYVRHFEHMRTLAKADDEARRILIHAMETFQT